MNYILKKWHFIFGALLLLASFYYFSNIWIYILLAAVISIIGRSLVDVLTKIKIKKWQVSKGLSAGVTLVIFWMLVYFFLSFFIPLVAHETHELSKIDINALQVYFAEPINNIQQKLDTLGLLNQDLDVHAVIKEKVSSVLNLEQVRSVFSNIVGVLGNVFIAIFSISFIAFFFLKDDNLLMELALNFAPKGKEIQVRSGLLKIIKLLSRYFVGLMIEVLSIITLVTLGLWIVGIGFSHAIVIGLVAGFLNVIPYVGPLIGTLFGTVIALATSLTEGVPDNLLWIFIAVLSVFMVAQLIDNFLLQPVIYSNSVNASPLEIFIVILMSGTLWGILGLMIAVPCYTIFRVVAKETSSQVKLIQKITKDI